MVMQFNSTGDAYMVCSGLPQRNGNEHCRQIVLLAMALLEMCNEFKVKSNKLVEAISAPHI